MAVEQYNEATTRLKDVQDRITRNQHLLKVAEYKLRRRQRPPHLSRPPGLQGRTTPASSTWSSPRRPSTTCSPSSTSCSAWRRATPSIVARRHGVSPGDRRPPHRSRGRPQGGGQAGGAARGEQGPGARAAVAARGHGRRPQERDRRPRGQGGGRRQGQGRGGRRSRRRRPPRRQLVERLPARRAPAGAAAAAPSSTPAAPATRRSSPSPSATSASPTSGAAPARAASTAPASPCTATRRSASASRTAPPTSSAPATPVPLSALQPGDLVFFGSASYSHHVGIYVGGGSMIDAPHTGAVVRYDSITGAWIGGRF